MDTELLKDRMPDLPDDYQDAFAQLAIEGVRKRARLERIASPSVATKLGIFIPLVLAVVFPVFGIATVNLPIVLVLLGVIQIQFFMVHSRMDAIYKLQNLGQPGSGFQNKRAAQSSAPGDSLQD